MEIATDAAVPFALAPSARVDATAAHRQRPPVPTQSRPRRARRRSPLPVVATSPLIYHKPPPAPRSRASRRPLQPIVFFPCPKIISSPEAGRKRPTSQAPPRVPRSARQWLPRRRPAASSRSPQSSPSPSAASRRRRRGRGTRWAGRTGGACRRRRTRRGSTPTGPPTSPSTSTTPSVQ